MRVLLQLSVLLLFGQAKCLAPRIDCQEYVLEGDSLTCSCGAPPDVDYSTDFSLRWTTGPHSHSLTVPNVTRKDSGSQYICQMTWKGQTYSTVYTLKVAYGPATVIINGPASFTTDGSLPLTLTCNATDVHPIPVYTWGNIRCVSNSRPGSCEFRPAGERDNGKEITCTVRNKLDKETKAKYTLNLLYPPPRPPVMQTSSNKQFIEKGDIISCIVSGGNPPVTSVVVDCSDPQLVYRLESHNNSTVSSSLAFVSTDRTSGSLECYCHAVWEPGKDLYRYNESRVFSIKRSFHNETAKQTPEKGSCQFPIAEVIGGVLAENVILIITVSVVCMKRSKKAVKEALSQEKPEHPYCSVKVNDRISLDMTGELGLPLYPRMVSTYGLSLNTTNNDKHTAASSQISPYSSDDLDGDVKT